VFDIIGKRRWYFLLSALVTIPGLIFILLTPISNGAAGLKFTIDYTGGTKWEIRFKNPNVTPDQVEAVFVANGLPASVVSTGIGFLEIKTEAIGLSALAPSPTPVPTLVPSASAGASGSIAPSASASAAISGSSASPAASTAASSRPSAAPSASPSPRLSPSPSPSPSPTPSASAGASVAPGASPSSTPAVATGNTELPTDGKLGHMVTALEAALGPIESQRSLTTIGPVVSSDLIQQALILIVVGSLGILAWITFRFHDVKFGVTALVALVHDVIVVVGTFAVLGTFFHVEIDALFVTAMLTVIGFSVHDTIVVFDRIRENRARHAGEPFAEVVNHSILQTFARSIMTSFTVVLTLLALLLFGGSAIRNFVLALLLGIISGTYSSIFNASPLLVVWQEWEDRRHGRATSTRAPRTRRAVS
jgi:preprotein translocase SecF subunit